MWFQSSNKVLNYKSPSSFTFLFSIISVTHDWTQSKINKCKISEMNKVISFELCAVMNSVMKSHAISPSYQGFESSLCSAFVCCICYPPISHLAISIISISTVKVLKCLWPCNPTLLKNSLDMQKEDTGNSTLSIRSCIVFALSGQPKVLNLIKKNCCKLRFLSCIII